MEMFVTINLQVNTPGLLYLRFIQLISLFKGYMLCVTLFKAFGNSIVIAHLLFRT